MDFQISADQSLLRDTVRRFVADRVAPRAREWDRAGRLPDDLLPELAELGLCGVTVASEWDGAGLGAVELALVIEELARGDGSLALSMAAHNGLCAAHVTRFGSKEQKQRYLGPLARGEKLGTWALSEPESGDDAAALACEAVRDGDGWRLSGAKSFVAQATAADLFIVLARTGPGEGSAGLAAFIVQRGAEGLGVRPVEEPLGLRASGAASLTLDEVRVSDASCIGEPGDGFAQATALLQGARINLGALAVGLGRGAIAAASRYAAERSQFGKPIAQMQAIQWKLADAATGVDAAALLVYRAAWLADHGRPFAREASMAKLLASEAAMLAADEAIQIHGGYGYTTDFPVERYYRDAKLCAVTDGTSELQRQLIAGEVTAGATF